MVKVSIVIPVYNCESYLEQCIKSIFCQSLNDLEIVCINDGSTDCSVKIIEHLQEEDVRIALYHQENQGAGAARNLGIRKAKGKYIAFLDADDYFLDADALELMFQTCETNGVAVCGSLRKSLENGTEVPIELFQNTEKNRILNYDDFQLDYDYQSFLFLRRHLIENEIFFPHYRRFQDPPFLVKALYAAHEFMVADAYLYCYRVSNWDVRFDTKKTEDLLCGLIDNLLFAQEHGLETLFKNTVSRIEHEYEIIICKNVMIGDLGILKILLQANQIVREQYKCEDYIISPIQTLVFYSNLYERELLNMLEGLGKIVLYGAGRYGRIFLAYLKKHGFSNKVKSFVVSNLKENEDFVDGIPVRTLQDEDAFIFVTAGERIQADVKHILDQKGYKNYILIKTEFLDLIDVE